MDLLIIEAKPTIPRIILDPEKGLIEMTGRCIPENPHEFYKPILDWIKQYGEDPQAETVVNIYLEYFNTSSSKCLLDLFKKLEEIHTAGDSKVMVNWQYQEDDEDMLESGEDYQAIIDELPFTMVERE